MDTILQPPSATSFDALSSVASAALYLVVAGAAMVEAPRDPRTRLFLLIAVSSTAPYATPAVLWAKGPAALTEPLILAVAVSLAVGSLALFHFAQVFPWRRPWIRVHWRWLLAAYLTLPAAVAVLTLRLSASFTLSGGNGYQPFEDASFGGVQAVFLILFSFAALILLGVIAPFAALLSFFNSWQTAKTAQIAAARVTTEWILISQLGGGVLTILVIPVLHLVAPAGPWAAIAAALLFGFSLMMPIAFAAGVWKYAILSVAQPD
jgi:hypothetical protein